VDLKVWCSQLLQRAYENETVVYSGLLFLVLIGLSQRLFGRRAIAATVFSQVHRTTKSQWMKKIAESYIFANRDAVSVDPEHSHRPDISRSFGNRLMVLKAPTPGGEKGVLLVMFSGMIQRLHSSMNLPKLLQDYTLVLEPSWSGYCTPELLSFTRFSEQIFVLAAEENDFDFLRRLGSNLIPINLGPCDWVDPRVAIPYLGNPKQFDIIMNSNWAAWKRHHALFRMLARAKHKYKVVLIGAKLEGRTASDIEGLASYFGVREQITILEQLPYEQVMDVTCRAKVSILLSLKEGSNRAIAESMFCNVPAIVLSNHVGGIKKNIVPLTGVLADEQHLESSIAELINSFLRPRDWAIENISCFISSDELNAQLRKNALNSGKPWTQDIAGRSSSPESKYILEVDKERLRPFNEELVRYLKEV
jgi:glycosyltransferase involved in cell wall biosynthesis